jgi:hypothetical protein
LEKLLIAIAEHPDVLSVERYASHFPDPSARAARQDYERRWGDGSGRVDAVKAKKALGELTTSLAAVFAHADKRVAHIEFRRPGVPLTFADLDKALDRIGELHRHWALLLTGSDHELTPIPQQAWQAIFARALFPTRGNGGPIPIS